MVMLLKRIKTKMYIASHKKALHALEGEYTSLMRGRSMDFEDLRNYADGDDVKDIDWKASARHQTPLVKQYIANRKQPVLFVVDSGRNMNAVTESGDTKKDLALTIVGVLGYLAIRHSDTVSLIVGDENYTNQFQARESETHLERLLQIINSKTTLDSGSSNIEKQLTYVQRNVKNRSLLVIVADEMPLREEVDILMKKLQAKHEVLWVSLTDGNPLELVGSESTSLVEDIGTGEYIPDFIRKNKKLKETFINQEEQRKYKTTFLLNRLGVSNTSVTKDDEIIYKLLLLLERRMNGKRK